jgi:hypothetical protein
MGSVDESPLAQAVRHAAEGRRIIVRQRALIERLRAKGHSTLEAEDTLDLFLRSQAIFEDDLHRLENKGQRNAAGTPMAHDQPSSDVNQRVEAD